MSDAARIKADYDENGPSNGHAGGLGWGSLVFAGFVIAGSIYALCKTAGCERIQRFETYLRKQQIERQSDGHSHLLRLLDESRVGNFSIYSPRR